ncbi:MAG: hypothetical protein AB7M12_07500 [Hyphomonadaceae bacterium]
MAEQTLPMRRGLLSSIHRAFIGAFLLIVMAIVLFANALIFSARAFQHNFAQLSGSPSGIVSMAMVRETARAVAVFEAEAAPLEARLADTQRAIEAANARMDALIRQLDQGGVRLAQQVGEAERRANLAADPADASLPALQSRIARLDRATRDRAATAALRTALASLQSAQSEITAAAADRDARQTEAQTLGRQLAEQRARLDARGLYKGDFNQIKAEIDSLENTGPFGLGLTLAQAHPTFLSALLVCSMGALGAILFLFPAFMTNTPEWRVTFVIIVVRMAFGMMTAFSFFLLVNSLIAAFGASALDASAPSLNPFTVSGLGIVAGLLSDRVAQWVFQRGAFLYAGAGAALDGAGAAAHVAAGTVKAAFHRPPRKGLFGPINPQGGPHDPAAAQSQVS